MHAPSIIQIIASRIVIFPARLRSSDLIKMSSERVKDRKSTNVRVMLCLSHTFAYWACVLLRIARTQTKAGIPNTAQ